MVRLELVEKKAHAAMATCATWAPTNVLYSCSDDQTILKWDQQAEVTGKCCELDAYVTSIAWMPSVGRGVSDVFAVSACDGSFRLVTGSGREEKRVAAHHGACLRVLWNAEGSALYSAGEDGEVKCWSKTGHLRSTLVKAAHPVYAVADGPGGDALAYVCDRRIHVAPVGDAKARQATSWVAHDQVALALDWNAANGLLVSGGEDCRYKVWDSFGRQLYQSQPHVHVVTAVRWSPNGLYFAVGAYDLLKLCDRTGWSCSRESPRSGAIMDICWTADGTQLVGAGGAGALVFAHVVERKHEWKNYEATLTGQRSIHVRDVLTEIDETLDFNRDRVVEMALGYGYLVVSTTTQIYVYNVANFNTPYIFDSPETVSFIQLAEKFFLVLPPAAVAVYTYDGRKVSTPRFAGLRADRLSAPVLSLSPDLVAVVDSTDRRTVRLCDVMTGKPREPAVKHTAAVAAVQLNQTPARQTHERQLLLVDRNDELWLYLCGTAEGHKLHTQVDSACWNETSEALCAIADGRLLVWGYPRVAFTDRDLLPGTLTTKDGAEFGQLAQVASFRGTKIVVRRADGAQVTATVAPYSDMLHEYGSQHRWDEAVGVCRFVEDRGCWCALASMALEASNLDVAEISLAALREVDKLQYILYVKSIPSAEARNAELALYKRRPDDAERILLQATPPLVYRAIKLRIRAFQRDKALDLAVKHRSHVDTVLAYRSKYLETYKKTETDDRFTQLNGSVEWSWEQVKSKKDLEKREEAARSGGPPPDKLKLPKFVPAEGGESKDDHK